MEAEIDLVELPGRLSLKDMQEILLKS